MGTSDSLLCLCACCAYNGRPPLPPSLSCQMIMSVLHSPHLTQVGCPRLAATTIAIVAVTSHRFLSDQRVGGTAGRGVVAAARAAQADVSDQVNALYKRLAGWEKEVEAAVKQVGWGGAGVGGCGRERGWVEGRRST